MVQEFELERERAMLTEERASDDDASGGDVNRDIDGDKDGDMYGDKAPASAVECVDGDEQSDAKRLMQQQLLVLEVRLRRG